MAQEADDGFREGIGKAAPFGKPFWADMHSTLIRVEISYATNSPDYDWGKIDTNYRPYVFANLGADIPIWSGNFKNGKYGFCLTLPFMIDVWYDRFEWITSPIINTSYRFGVFDIGFIYRLDSPMSFISHFNIYNWALKFSAFKHESTHLGDELIVFREKQNMPITRVDVAYNYAELIFTVNDPDRQTHLNHGYKFGFLTHYRLNESWYDVLESEAQPDLVEHSRIPFEFFIQYQFQSPLFSRGFQIITSIEYRLRERYKYPFSYSGSMSDDTFNKSNLANCFNFYAGVRYDNQQPNYFSKIGMGIRYYVGINPYGQFRSMPYYSQFGMVVIFE